MDYLLSEMSLRGWRVKSISVGSMGGITAAKRGECDLAGSHLLDEKTGQYNVAYLDASLSLEKGYGRKQGFVFRKDDPRFTGKALADAVKAALSDPACLMINRNRGSGTRVLIDGLLGKTRPPGFHVEAKSHNAVAAAVAQGRADWGIAIEHVAQGLGLGFLPMKDEEYDFFIPKARVDRPAVKAFLSMLKEPDIRAGLARLGMTVRPLA